VDEVVKSFDSPFDEPVVNAVQQVAETRGISPKWHVFAGGRQVSDCGVEAMPNGGYTWSV
jgi:hypothetical protein